MPEFRTDPLRGHTVLINAQRGKRPSEFLVHIEAADSAHCPFCRGHESSTPPSIEQDCAPDWNWRVFLNLFPAVQSTFATDLLETSQGLTMAATGRHEVLVESPDHNALACDYSVEHWTDLLSLWQRRLRDLYADESVRYVHIFRNQGFRGGATLVHPHQQIVGLPFVPEQIAFRIARNKGGAESECAHCEWLNSEIGASERVIAQEDGIVALASFAPRFPFEWQVMETEHRRFDQIPQRLLSKVALVLKSGLRALSQSCKSPDFNLVLFSVPPGVSNSEGGWAIDILPRMSTQAGFEWGTGVHIVSTPPEEAVKVLRSSWPVDC
ncbi:MAG: DUF4931 domain-containing protein [Calditrichaeota bacterium]|nr:DUF4931 domain-containing protein [Calditrichota bacterium]MCB9366385.1 DUF4931 domain-containing protein [Calditrichota bacterium]MCB9391985.1 DUF4931 domain-containing protein [Calditrichota bacterium]